MDKSWIDTQLKYGERLTLECKEAEGNIPKSMWETYSSFANTEGGVIFFGIKEHLKENDPNKKFEIQGIKNGQKRVKEFWDTINSKKTNTNILVDEDVQIVDYDGHDILCILVPQASYRQKPIYINENPMKGTYKRNYEGDYHCTEDEIKAMIRDSSDAGIDGLLLRGYTESDLDFDTIKSYRIEYSIKNPDHVWNNDDDITFLRNLGGIATDRDTGKEWLTLAGLMMFGKGLSIRERFDNIRMDYIDETNLLGDSRWSDRLTYDGNWENNLYNFFRRVMPKLTSEIRRPFKMDGISRVDDTPVHKAIREAVVNMIIHTDYYVMGIMKIIKKDNRFEFSNPGSLKLPVEKIYKGGVSTPRNPRIQNMFRMIGYGDNIGSGFPTILNAWKDENWRRPDLSEDPDIHTVELKLWTVSMMPEECSIYLNQLLGERTYASLSSEEQLILGTAYLEESVTNSRMQNMLEMHATDIGKVLFGLVEKEMLISDSRGRWTTYRINTGYKKKPEQLHISDIEEPPIHLNKTDRTIYEYIRVNGTITVKQVLENTRIKSRSGANVALNRLIEKGLIIRKRHGNDYYYVLSD